MTCIIVGCHRSAHYLVVSADLRDLLVCDKCVGELTVVFGYRLVDTVESEAI